MKSLAFLIATVALAQPANEQFLKWMDATAQQQLAERDKVIRAIKTPDQIAARKKEVREKILNLIGGLPEHQGSLRAQTIWRKDMGRYVIEGVRYESIPGYFVTANLYRPRALGKYPAILFSIGHWDAGKASAQLMAANLALKGFIVLAYDPVGQGERHQSFDSRLNRSIIGGPTEQHFMAGALAVLAKQNIARYMIWDGMRSIDYLQSRDEVDSTRIGAMGCSGGGTQTTYIAALDDRVSVAVPACYMQSFKMLFSGPVGDSEQSLPGFISSGLDQTDYVELFSPKPWLITSTEEDFFKPESAKIVYEEARNWYEMQGAQDRIKWVVGPGGHGMPLIVREAIYDWMIRWLRKDERGAPQAKEEQVDLLPDHDLLVSQTGQIGGLNLYEIIRGELKAETRVPSLPDDPYDFNSQLIERSGDTAVVVVETGDLPGKKAQQFADQGVTVLAINPRGYPVARYGSYSGDWATNERAWLIGKNLPLMRTADIAAAVKQLKSRSGINRVMVYAPGVGGYWALYALANDPSISRVWVDKTPWSILAAFEQGVHQDLHDVVIPGVVPHFEPSSKIFWTDPTDWMRNIVKRPGQFVYRNVIVDDDDQRLVSRFLKR